MFIKNTRRYHLYLVPNKCPRRKLMMDSTMLKSIATQKSLTSNPFIIDEVSNIKSAFITKVNNPSVKMLIGRVISIRKGLMRTLIIPIKSATHRAAKKPFITTPGMTYAASIIDVAMISHLRSNIIFCIHYVTK